MKSIILIAILSCLFFQTEALKNLMGTEIQKCVNCLCHARSGCWSRYNCARYSVSFDYWKAAKSPVLDPNDDPDSQASYKKCMGNENCIVNTIYQYTNSFNDTDCNCDGTFDCKDMFAIHLFGRNCKSPNFGRTYARRFNECAKSIGVNVMEIHEGDEECLVEVS
ncbi:hypothetical protein HHI36_014173 [Cryptolaemus montrouzieri]|uniref:lysozyme n=1 Tax=Cryptolaemus montrouzieri TaxID=559131 RepID=A0ABD2N2Z8_9CUCU